MTRAPGPPTIWRLMSITVVALMWGKMAKVSHRTNPIPCTRTS